MFCRRRLAAFNAQMAPVQSFCRCVSLGRMLSGCQNQVVSYKLQTTPQANKSRCFLERITFWLSSKRNGKYRGYPYFNKSWVSFSLLLSPLSMNVTTFFCSFYETTVVSCVFLWHFAREIGARMARIDLLAHAQHFTLLFQIRSPTRARSYTSKAVRVCLRYTQQVPFEKFGK